MSPLCHVGTDCSIPAQKAPSSSLTTAVHNPGVVGTGEDGQFVLLPKLQPSAMGGWDIDYMSLVAQPH